MTKAQESAVTAIGMYLGVPVTLAQAMRLTDLWILYYGAAVKSYGEN